MKKKVPVWALIVTAALSIIMTLTAVSWVLQKETGDFPGFVRFFYTMKLIRQQYVGEYEDKKLFQGAMGGMVKSLDDPYSAYLDEKAYKSMTEVTDGTFGGIGVVLGQKDGEFTVVAPMDGSPGAAAGIKSGDIILKVDDKDVRGRTLEDVVSTIRGPKGSQVKILLKHKDGGEYTADITRDDIKIQSVASKMLDDTKIGYIRISVFNESTGADFAKAYAELEQQGMQATLLDLRQNPGGLLTECLKVANYIVPKGTIVSTTDKNGRTTVARSKLEKIKYPLAVLVDHGSASASEIVSGAVQDTKAGRLFGMTTYGKGCVQTVYHLSSDTGLKLTTAMYYTPSGRSIHKTGITPDVEIDLPKDAKEDVQLKAAEDYLKEEIAKGIAQN